jgi:RNA polymerase sigma factor (sigma-70 family)
MSEEISFQELLRRVRAGDAAATNLLVARYGDAVRRTARVRLRSTQLRRILDSTDIWQSVMASFFKRAVRGGWKEEPQTPDDLLKLLATMVRHKVIDQARRANAERRGGGKGTLDLFGDRELFAPAPGDTPSEQVVKREQAELVKELLTAEERRVWDLRAGEGLEWADIAARVGATPEALRKQWERTRKRIRQQLGEEDDHGRA